MKLIIQAILLLAAAMLSAYAKGRWNKSASKIFIIFSAGLDTRGRTSYVILEVLGAFLEQKVF